MPVRQVKQSLKTLNANFKLEEVVQSIASQHPDDPLFQLAAEALKLMLQQLHDPQSHRTQILDECWRFMSLIAPDLLLTRRQLNWCRPVNEEMPCYEDASHQIEGFLKAMQLEPAYQDNTLLGDRLGIFADQGLEKTQADRWYGYDCLVQQCRSQLNNLKYRAVLSELHIVLPEAIRATIVMIDPMVPEDSVNDLIQLWKRYHWTIALYLFSEFLESLRVDFVAGQIEASSKMSIMPVLLKFYFQMYPEERRKNFMELVYTLNGKRTPQFKEQPQSQPAETRLSKAESVVETINVNDLALLIPDFSETSDSFEETEELLNF